MIKSIIAAFAVVLTTTFGLVGPTSTVPAEAVLCHYHYDYDYAVSGSGGKKVTQRLYVCHYSSPTSTSIRNVRFTWRDGTFYIRRLYDNGPDLNIQKRCGSATTWTTIMNRSSYYNGVTYWFPTSVRNCPTPSYVRTDLTADVKLFPDSPIRF